MRKLEKQEPNSERRALDGMDYIANVSKLKHLVEEIEWEYDSFRIPFRSRYGMREGDPIIRLFVVPRIQDDKSMLEKLIQKAEDTYTNITELGRKNKFDLTEPKESITKFRYMASKFSNYINIVESKFY